MVTERVPASRLCPSLSAPGLAACGELGSVPACVAGRAATPVAVGVVRTVPAPCQSSRGRESHWRGSPLCRGFGWLPRQPSPQVGAAHGQRNPP